MKTNMQRSRRKEEIKEKNAGVGDAKEEENDDREKQKKREAIKDRTEKNQ